MSDCSSSCSTPQMDTTTKQLFEAWGCSEDEDRRTTRREKNRVAAQKSRKRQTQRADLLHEACELLEQKNRKLRKEQVKARADSRCGIESVAVHLQHAVKGAQGM
ncbi:basic leucine zipper transcriptional factor ATF-like 3 isoform X3 [Melanotaenia boesemani]|uniref:basic leucine zipper transcriptional factor ATF-like 3 isoform X3 n=1 Tax=Melanotaenia boesemani TaxID=1250792 RepID=UPI001C05A2D4|nr:basic leucine zipper transcriptional factor ATF-like 3 isoform X3 [Melanotaenia boesemani]